MMTTHSSGVHIILDFKFEYPLLFLIARNRELMKMPILIQYSMLNT